MAVRGALGAVGLSNDYRFIKISQSAREKLFSYCEKIIYTVTGVPRR